MRSWNKAQRVVGSVGFGVVMYVIATTTASWAVAHSEQGWFNYAPNSSVTFSPGATNWWAVAVWIVAAAIWTAVSVWLFAGPRTKDEGRETTTEPIS